MPKGAAPASEKHRPALSELVKQKIREIEFKVAIELFASVARLVSKEEIARNPKAKAALDKEQLQKQGCLDEKRVRECRDIVAEARREGKTVHLGRIFEACYEKDQNCRSQIRATSLKAGRRFKGTMFVMRTLTMPSLMSGGLLQPQWKLRSCLMHSAVNQGFENSRQMPFKHIYKPSSQGSQHGCRCPETDGLRIGKRVAGNPWFPCC